MIDLIIAQTRYEIGTALRNGEQLLVSLVLPVFALVGLGRLAPVSALTIAMVVAISGTCLTSLSISLAYDRRYGAIKAMTTSPLGARGYLAGRITAILVICLFQILVLAAVAAMTGLPASVGPLGALAVALFAVGCSGLAFWLASRMRAEGVLATSNLLLVLIGGASAGSGLDATASFLVWSPAGLIQQASDGSSGAFAIMAAGAFLLVSLAARDLRLD